MNLLLLKEPKEDDSGPDPYIKELELCGHKPTLIPVLSFTFVSLETLCQKLLQPEKFGGLIFTSPRAVEAARTCLETHSKMEEWDASVKDRWNVRLVYVVGKATAALVRSLGLVPQGEDSGTASVLSQFILENAADEPQKSPFLFPCGSIKREVLPTTLREHGVPLETLTVYQTAQHPDLERNLTDYFSEKGVPASVAFFSPSGVRFCLETVRRLSGPDLSRIKTVHITGSKNVDCLSVLEGRIGKNTALDRRRFAAIGPTTADAMVAEGVTVSCTAEKPTAQHLAQGIAQVLQ